MAGEVEEDEAVAEVVVAPVVEAEAGDVEEVSRLYWIWARRHKSSVSVEGLQLEKVLNPYGRRQCGPRKISLEKEVEPRGS